MAKQTSTPQHPGRGLVNPTITPRKTAGPVAHKPGPTKTYQTHVPEPRWQRIISLVIIAGIVAFELYFWLHRHK